MPNIKSLLAFVISGCALASLPAPAQNKTVPVAAPVPHVYIFGAVAKSGLYNLKPGDRIIDALAKAGGPTADANLSLLYTVHFDKEKRGSQLDVNFNDFVLYGNSKGNPLIGYGDTIYVPRKKNYVPQPPEFSIDVKDPKSL